LSADFRVVEKTLPAADLFGLDPDSKSGDFIIPESLPFVGSSRSL